jgi:hypothetical protein
MKNRLKPMGVGTILDNTFSILRERFWTFQGVNFIAFLPIFIVLCIIIGFLIVSLLPYRNIIDSNLGQRFWMEVMSRMGLNILILILLMIILVVVGVLSMIYFTYGNIKLFKCGLHQEKCTIKEAFAGIKGKRWRFVGVSMVMFLMAFPIWITAMILTYKYAKSWGTFINYLNYPLYFLFCLNSVVLCLETLNIRKTLSRSFSLMAKHRWRILGTLILVYILGYILMLILVGLIAVPIGIAVAVHNLVTILLAILFGIFGLLVLSLFGTYFLSPLTAIYYDLLIRKEGYDIQQQLQENNIENRFNLNERSLDS